MVGRQIFFHTDIKELFESDYLEWISYYRNVFILPL